MFSSPRATPLMLLVLGGLAVAGVARADEFPEGSTVLALAEMQAQLAGKVFDVKTASGVSWRLQLNDNGFFFVDVSNGFRDTGTWAMEGSQLCTKPVKGKPACNELRRANAQILLKRDSGEIVAMVLRP